MLFQPTRPLPQSYYIAVSGGPDSMAILAYLSKYNVSKIKGVLHYNHGSGEFADQAEKLVTNYCQDKRLLLLKSKNTETPPKGESKEAFWREKRYKFFAQINGEQIPIILGHNLNDCVEEYIINCFVRFHPERKVIGYYGPCCTIRPFRTWRKESMVNYCEANNIPYLNDPSNNDPSFLRNNIRLNLIPEILKVNKGLFTTITKMIVSES